MHAGLQIDSGHFPVPEEEVKEGDGLMCLTQNGV